MRITAREELIDDGRLETTTAAELAARRAERAEQAALANAGVTPASGFAEAPPALVASPEQPAPVADPTLTTVRASQLANGTASLDEPAGKASPLLFTPPPGADDLASIMGGKDGSTPLTREQVTQTVLDALPAEAQAAASALLSSELGVTDSSLANAFNQVIEARKTPGDRNIAFELEANGAWRSNRGPGEGAYRGDGDAPSYTQEILPPTPFSATVRVDDQGRVNGKQLAADAATVADYRPYPDGNSADHVKAQFSVVGDPGNLATLTAAHGDQPALPRQAIVDTLIAVAPAARDLIAAGVTDESLARAFSKVIEARKSPGEKPLALDLVALESHTEQVGVGEYITEVTSLVPAAHPTSITATMSVAEDGTVNGARLPADVATQITSAARNVPQEFKDATLREVGLSEEWLANASQEQKDYALARVVDAKDTPGQKQLDFSYGYTVTQYASESEYTQNLTAAGVINLTVGADGLVNGKALTAEMAFNATRTVEAMPTAVRRATLLSLGFKDDAIAKGSPEQEKYALIKASVATATPGDAQFEVHMGGDKYAVGLKIGEDHSIQGAGTAFIEPPRKKNWFKAIASIALTVVATVATGGVALAAVAANTALAISSGAKGLGLVAAVAGAAAGFAGFAGYTSMANTLSNVATTASTINGAANAVKAFQNGDLLGALSGAASLAGGFVEGDLGQTLSTIGTVAGGARALQRGDIAGALGAGLSVASGLTSGETAETLRTLGQIGTTVSAAANGNIDAAVLGVLNLTGLNGRTTQSIAGGPTAPPVSDAPSWQDYAADLDALTSTTQVALDGDVGGVLQQVLDTDPLGNFISGLSGAETPFYADEIPSVDFSDVPAGGVEAPLPATTRVVQRGDTLSKIAQATLGDANRWPELYAYNVAKLGGVDPNKVPIGAELQIPPSDFTLPSSTRNAMFNAAYIPPPPPPAVATGGMQVIDLPSGSDGPSFSDLSQATPSIFGNGTGTSGGQPATLSKTGAELQAKAVEAFKEGKYAMGIKYVTESANATIRETGGRPGPIGWLMGQIVSGIAEDTATALSGVNTDGQQASNGARVFAAAMVGVNFVPGGTAAKEGIIGLKASDTMLEAAAAALPKGFTLSENFRPTVVWQSVVDSIDGVVKGGDVSKLLQNNFDAIANAVKIRGGTTLADLGDAARYAMPSEAAMTKSLINLPYAETVVTWANANKIEAGQAMSSVATHLDDLIGQVRSGGVTNVFSGTVETIAGTVTQSAKVIQDAQLDRLLRARTELAEMAALAESNIKLKAGQVFDDIRGSLPDAVFDKMSRAIEAAYKAAGRKGP